MHEYTNLHIRNDIQTCTYTKLLHGLNKTDKMHAADRTGAESRGFRGVGAHGNGEGGAQTITQPFFFARSIGRSTRNKSLHLLLILSETLWLASFTRPRHIIYMRGRCYVAMWCCPSVFVCVRLHLNPIDSIERAISSYAGWMDMFSV